MAGHGCCQGCSHLGVKGCSVQALACKLWVCDDAYEDLPFLAKVELYTLLTECDVTLFFRYDGFKIEEHMMNMFPGWTDPRQSYREFNRKILNA